MIKPLAVHVANATIEHRRVRSIARRMGHALALLGIGWGAGVITYGYWTLWMAP